MQQKINARDFDDDGKNDGDEGMEEDAFERMARCGKLTNAKGKAK